MKKIILIIGALTSIAASAYKDGTYECKTANGYPANIYKIKTVEITPGVRLPYLDLTHFYKGESGVVSSNIRGLGFIFESGSTETISIGNVSLEFSGDSLLRCKAP